MNQTFQNIKNSKHDSDLKWYKEFDKAIGRQELHVRGCLT